MAITITTQPEGIYPCFNDSYIKFNSNLAGSYKAEIIAYPTNIFAKSFTIYSDLEGNYLFNLKEVVKVIFNENGFKDGNFDTSLYYRDATGLYLYQQIDIKVYNDSTSEQINLNYEFFKATKQIGEEIFTNHFQLLSFSRDGINHSLTYFEGFPFSFDIQKVTQNLEIVIKSLNTGNETQTMTPEISEAFRINIDKGGASNWTYDNYLTLITGLNRLEIWENGYFKTNLLITKKKICSGVYLKWWNRNGGFSHYLFDKFFSTEIKGADSGEIINSDFKNINEATSFYKSLGKNTEQSINIKTRYEQRDFGILKDIFESPLVQMYTSNVAYVEGRFIDVRVNGTIAHNNKRAKNEIAITVNLPETITAKL